MFDRFGELDSYEQLNELAENLFNEGDLDGIRTLAEENGIGEFAGPYIEGDIPSLCDAETAAVGKLTVEADALKLKGLMLDWLDYAKALAAKKEPVAIGIRKKNRSLEGCMAVLLKAAFQNQMTVDSKIIKAAGIKGAGKVTFGVPSMGEAKKLISDYYGGKK